MDKEFLEAFSKLSKIINIVINAYIPEKFETFVKPIQSQVVGHLWLNPEKTKKLYQTIKVIIEEE